MSAAKTNTSNFLKQGTILAAASIIVRMIGIIYRIPMGNIIGSAGNGIYSVAFDIYGLALILSSYSIPLAVSKMVSARLVNKEYKNAYRIFKCSMIFAIISGGAMALIIYFGAGFIEKTFYSKVEGLMIPLQILAPTIFISAVMGVLRGYFQGKNTMIPTAVSQIIEQVVNAVVSVVAALFLMRAHSASDNIAAWGAGGGTLGTAFGAAASLAFLAFIYIIYRPVIKKQIKRDTVHEEESYSSVFKTLMLTILPVILSQTVFNVSGVIDNSMFGTFVGRSFSKDQVQSLIGVYGQDYRLLVNVPIAISTAVVASMLPSIVASYTLKLKSEVKAKLSSAVKFNMLIAFPSAVGLSVLGEQIDRMLFPSFDYVTGGKLLWLGSIAIVFYSLSTVTSGLLQGINQMKIPVINNAISLVIHIGIVFCLLKYANLNVYALVIGNVTFPLVVCILNWREVANRLHYKQEIRKTFLIPFIASGIMGAVTFGAYQGIHLLIHSNIISTLAAMMVAVLVYFIAIMLLKGVTEDELYTFPMGRTITRIAKKMHLL